MSREEQILGEGNIKSSVSLNSAKAFTCFDTGGASRAACTLCQQYVRGECGGVISGLCCRLVFKSRTKHKYQGEQEFLTDVSTMVWVDSSAGTSVVSGM